MRLKYFSLIVLFCLSHTGYSQFIYIHYHLGFDCSTNIDNELVHGGCATHERVNFIFDKRRKCFKSYKLESVQEIRRFKDGKFGDNLKEDSLALDRIRKIIRSSELNDILNYVVFAQSSNNLKNDSNLLSPKILISNLDRNTFKLSRKDFRYIEKSIQKRIENKDSAVHIIANYLRNKNRAFISSSTVEWLKVSFDVLGKRFKLSQNNLGGVNASWELEVDDNVYFIVSPELNELIAGLLPNSMNAKSELMELFDVKELEKAFFMD